MATVTKGSKFPAKVAEEIFNKVKGKSSLAKMCAAEGVPFNGKDIFTFSLDNEIQVVGESGAKAPQNATVATVQMRPIKVVYQARVTDEFLYASEEAKLDMLSQFTEGFARKLAKGLDLMALHGVDPSTGSASSIIGNNHIDYCIPSANKVVYLHDSTAADYNLNEAIAKVVDPTGIIMGGTMRTAIGALSANGAPKYPEFNWGAVPNKLGNMLLDCNTTVEANSNADRAIVGDFNAFRWGFAKELPLEIIEYGNPDNGTYDLKRANEVLLRSEAYLGWAILDNNAFASVYVSE